MTTAPASGPPCSVLRKYRGKRSLFFLEIAPGDMAGLEVARRLAFAADDLEYWRARAVVAADRSIELPLELLRPRDAFDRTRLTVADRWGEVMATYEDDFPSAEEIVEWAKFLEISCGSCGDPS